LVCRSSSTNNDRQPCLPSSVLLEGLTLVSACCPSFVWLRAWTGDNDGDWRSRSPGLPYVERSSVLFCLNLNLNLNLNPWNAVSRLLEWSAVGWGWAVHDCHAYLSFSGVFSETFMEVDSVDGSSALGINLLIFIYRGLVWKSRQCAEPFVTGW